MKFSVNCRSTDGILAKEMSLEGGNKNGETITADIKTGEKVSLSYAAPEGKRLAGWTVTYYSWHSASSPGWTDSVASDSVKADGQKIASKVNSDGGALYSLDDSTFGFTITADMKAIKTNTPLRIAITPIFKDAVTEISGVPDEMNMGDVFDLGSVKILPAGAASASDIQWTRRDVNGEKELGGTFSPDSTGATMLEARIKDGLGIGTDYVQSFKVEAGTVRLIFYKDMARKTIGKELSVEAGTPLAEYAETVPEEIPEDHSFAGWDSSTYSHMPGENKTIKAVWTKGEEPAGGNDKPSGGNDKPSGGNNKPAATTEKTDNTVKAGSKFKIAGNTYKVISAKKKTVSLAKAVKSKKTFVLPASVKIKGKKYKVTGIEKMAFKGTKTKTITIKTKKLKKKSVKGSLKGSKVKTIKVKVGKKSLNKKYVKKYKKIFTKKNTGKKVTVK